MRIKTSTCKSPGRELAIYPQENGGINLHLALMNPPSEQLSLTEKEKYHLLEFLLAVRKNDLKILCKDCTHLENLFRKAFTIPKWQDIYGRDLKKHRETCEIYEGESK